MEDVMAAYNEAMRRGREEFLANVQRRILSRMRLMALAEKRREVRRLLASLSTPSTTPGRE